MFACDICDNWYHSSRVNKENKEIMDAEEFVLSLLQQMLSKEDKLHPREAVTGGVL